jgi:hypothetical protein
MKRQRTLFVFDIDATLADATERFAKAGKEPSRESQQEYLAWLERLQTRESLALDNPVAGMANLLHALWAGGGTLCYVTGREECYRQVTLDWLLEHRFPLTGPLFMRKPGDWGSVRQVKEPWIKYQQQVLQATSVIVVDDDPNGDVALMCQDNGWTFLKACSGGKHT